MYALLALYALCCAVCVFVSVLLCRFVCRLRSMICAHTKKKQRTHTQSIRLTNTRTAAAWMSSRFCCRSPYSALCCFTHNTQHRLTCIVQTRFSWLTTVAVLMRTVCSFIPLPVICLYCEIESILDLDISHISRIELEFSQRRHNFWPKSATIILSWAVFMVYVIDIYNYMDISSTWTSETWQRITCVWCYHLQITMRIIWSSFDYNDGKN